MNHQDELKLATYINKMYTPEDVKITLKIYSHQTNKDGECMIYLRLRRYDPLLRKDIKEKMMPTGQRVTPKNWSSKKCEVLKGDLKYTAKNRKIKDKLQSVTKYIYNPKLDYIMAQLSKDEFSLIEEVFPSERMLKYKKHLVNYIDDYYNRRKDLGNPRGTIKEFLTVKNRIVRFDDSRDKRTFLKDIGLVWADDLEIWMNKEDYAKGTIQKTYTILVTVLNHYWEYRHETKTDITDAYQSKKFKRGEKSINKPNPLTKAQVDCLYNYRFTGKNKHLETTRKMMLIQCSIGCRYGDLKKIRPQMIDDKILMFDPAKGERYNVTVEQPLNILAWELLQEASFDTSVYKMANQPYNRNIKTILEILAADEKCKHLKFKTDHTSHNFRDTFISIAVQSGVNFKSILQWVGQSSYQIMDRYIKLNKEFNKSEMKKMY
jgi:hypothetical protein